MGSTPDIAACGLADIVGVSGGSFRTAAAVRLSAVLGGRLGVEVDQRNEADVRRELAVMTTRLASAQAEAALYQRRIDELLWILNEHTSPKTETPRLRSV